MRGAAGRSCRVRVASALPFFLKLPVLCDAGDRARRGGATGERVAWGGSTARQLTARLPICV